MKATIRPQDEPVGLLSVLHERWNARGDQAIVEVAIHVLGLFEGRGIIEDKDEDKFDSDE